MWITTMTRPDLPFVVYNATKFGNNPGGLHWEVFMKELQYLERMVNFEVMYGGVKLSRYEGVVGVGRQTSCDLTGHASLYLWSRGGAWRRGNQLVPLGAKGYCYCFCHPPIGVGMHVALIEVVSVARVFCCRRRHSRCLSYG